MDATRTRRTKDQTRQAWYGADPINLLRLPGVTLEDSTAPRGEWQGPGRTGVASCRSPSAPSALSAIARSTIANDALPVTWVTDPQGPPMTRSRESGVRNQG